VYLYLYLGETELYISSSLDFRLVVYHSIELVQFNSMKLASQLKAGWSIPTNCTIQNQDS